MHNSHYKSVHSNENSLSSHADSCCTHNKHAEPPSASISRPARDWCLQKIEWEVHQGPWGQVHLWIEDNFSQFANLWRKGINKTIFKQWQWMHGAVKWNSCPMWQPHNKVHSFYLLLSENHIVWRSYHMPTLYIYICPLVCPMWSIEQLIRSSHWYLV